MRPSIPKGGSETTPLRCPTPTYDPASESPPHTDGSHGLGLFGLNADNKQGNDPRGHAVEAEQVKFASADDAQKERY